MDEEASTKELDAEFAQQNLQSLSELTRVINQVTQRAANDNKHEEQEGRRVLRHELRHMQKLRNSIEDRAARGHISEVLWKYSTASKRLRQELPDDEQLQHWTLGKRSEKRRQLGQRLQPVYLLNDEGKKIPRSDWNDLFAKWWNKYWSPDGSFGEFNKPRRST